MDYTKRQKIGILFYYGKNWMGGVIYIINLIKSLNKLSDQEKPEIILFYNDKSKTFLNEIEYPYITLVYKKTKNDYIGYLLSFLHCKNIFEDGLISHYKLDGLFPLCDFPFSLGENNFKAAAWYPDLQHKFYPQYFSKLKILFREWRIKLIIKNASNIVLSSNDVYNHFKKFYNLKTKTNFHILKFTSITEGLVFPPIEDLKTKYDISSDYFIVSNQFWQHKNHIIVFKAIKLLKDANVNCKIVFTGMMEGNRNQFFIEEIKRLIIDFNLNEYVIFVGLISREHQLCLMKNSLAVIQPSLFEGWSTVIEDAKALKCQIIASNLDVHKEQLEYGKFGFLFEPTNEVELAKLLNDILTKNIILKPFVDNYQKLTIDFALAFINIFHN